MTDVYCIFDSDGGLQFILSSKREAKMYCKDPDNEGCTWGCWYVCKINKEMTITN